MAGGNPTSFSVSSIDSGHSSIRLSMSGILLELKKEMVNNNGKRVIKVFEFEVFEHLKQSLHFYWSRKLSETQKLSGKKYVRRN